MQVGGLASLATPRLGEEPIALSLAQLGAWWQRHQGEALPSAIASLAKRYALEGRGDGADPS